MARGRCASRIVGFVALASWGFRSGARIGGMLHAVLAIVFFATQQITPARAEWNQPVEPFKIIGNLYYVGASDVTSYAIVTPDGIILIDTGFRETVPLIKANI